MNRMVAVERRVLDAFAARTAVPEDVTLEYWAAVQALLGAAGNVSKLLWPPGRSDLGAVPGRGEQVRQLLAIPNDSPLRDRTARDHAEHFDERLERWASRTVRRDFVDMSAGPIERVASQGIEVGDIMRFLDIDRRKLYFAGEVFELNPLRAALRDAHDRAIQARETISRMYEARED